MGTRDDECEGQTIVIVADGVVCKVLLCTLLPGYAVSDWNRIGPIHNVAISELIREKERGGRVRERSADGGGLGILIASDRCQVRLNSALCSHWANLLPPGTTEDDTQSEDRQPDHNPAQHDREQGGEHGASSFW